MRRLSRAVVALTLAASAVAFGTDAYAFPSIQLPRQQKLLNRACDVAAARLEKLVNGTATTPALTVQTQVRLLRPGKLAADIAFNPSGNTISVAADGSAASTVNYACGDSIAGFGGGAGAAPALVSVFPSGTSSPNCARGSRRPADTRSRLRSTRPARGSWLA